LASEKKILEDKNKELERLLLEKPPETSIVSMRTGLLILGITAVASFVVGGYLGTKL